MNWEILERGGKAAKVANAKDEWDAAHRYGTHRCGKDAYAVAMGNGEWLPYKQGRNHAEKIGPGFFVHEDGAFDIKGIRGF